MDNDQDCDSYINTPSSQTYGSYFFEVVSKLFLLDRVVLQLPMSFLQEEAWRHGDDVY
jgi:hypothetical protein